MTPGCPFVSSTRRDLHFRGLPTHPAFSHRLQQRGSGSVQQVQHSDVIPDGPIGFGVARAELAIDAVHRPDGGITPERLIEHENDFEDPLFFRRQRLFVIHAFTVAWSSGPVHSSGVQALIIL
jgi:hypothetical protein